MIFRAMPEKIPGFGAGPKEHWRHSVKTTEIANLQFLRFRYCQELRPSLTPFPGLQCQPEDRLTTWMLILDPLVA